MRRTTLRSLLYGSVCFVGCVAIAPAVAQPCDDFDLDGVCDPVDNCPNTFNPSQADCDLDGRGDACDPCSDCDADFVPDRCVPSDTGEDCCPPPDNCPDVANANQTDLDADGHGDACDNCPGVSNVQQLDFDEDGFGDACDDDDDNDGVLDPFDCAQFDPAEAFVPGEVRDVSLSKQTVTRLRWFEKDPDDRYDLVGATFGDLRLRGNAASRCVADDVGPESWDDPRPDPSPGEGFFYLVRAQSSCGSGTYGRDSSDIERQPGSDCP